MIIEPFEPFAGQHCETTASGTLLKHAGLDLPEPMLFGIGQGLGFIYWDMKAMDFPFLGGRIKQNLITGNLARNLGLELRRLETSSVTKAWQTVRASIDAGVPVGLQLDSYYLEYFTAKVHFGGHFVAMYGYDNSRAYLVDTAQQGTRATAGLTSYGRSRAPEEPKRQSLRTADHHRHHHLEEAIANAVLARMAAGAYRLGCDLGRYGLHPPISAVVALKSQRALPVLVTAARSSRPFGPWRVPLAAARSGV